MGERRVDGGTSEKIIHEANTFVTGGIDAGEKQQLAQKLSTLSSDERISLQRSLDTGKERINHDVKAALQELLAESKSFGFDKLGDDLKKENDILAGTMHTMFTDYLDQKFKQFIPPLRKAEKDAIALVLFGRLISAKNLNEELGKTGMKFQEIFSEKDPEKIKTKLGDLKKSIVKDHNSKRDFHVFCEKILGEGVWTTLKSVKKMNTGNGVGQQKQVDLTDISFISRSLDSNRTSLGSISHETQTTEKIYEDVKKKALALGTDTNQFRKVGTQIKGLIDSLPGDGAKEIRDTLHNFVKKHAFFGVILSLLFGKDFVDGYLSGETEKLKKMNTSLDNLMVYVGNSEKSKLSGIDTNTLKANVSPDKLTAFFEYIKGKGIEYEKEGFWEAIFTGNTKDEKLKAVYESLAFGLDKKVPLFTEKDFESSSEGFVTKLNNIEQREKEKIAKKDSKT